MTTKSAKDVRANRSDEDARILLMVIAATLACTFSMYVAGVTL